MNRNPKVLLVEDDKLLGDTIKAFLEKSGFTVEHTLDGSEAWQLYNRNRYDICLVDIVIPKMNGYELVREIRTKNMVTPIFFLSSEKVQDEDRITGFHAGGDGYLIKPFSFEELLKRMQVILKWTRPNKTELLIGHQVGEYTFHYRKLKIYETKTKIVSGKLSPIEARMLRHFMSRPNVIIQKEEVLLRVWNRDDFFASRSMDVFIGRIRKQLRQILPSVELETVYNVGLRLNVPPELMPIKLTIPLT